MASYLNDTLKDLLLAYIDDNCDRLDITSALPSAYSSGGGVGVLDLTLGNKTTPTIGVPEDGASSGRRVIISAITDGTVTGTGTASHWALSDAGNTLLLAAQTLSAPQGVTSGNTFTLTQFDITIPDPT